MKKEKAIEVKAPSEQDITNKKKHLSNLKAEALVMQEQEEDVKMRLTLLDEEIKLTDDNFKIVYDNFELIKPTWKFEESKDYMEKTRQINRISHFKKMQDYKVMRKRLEQNVKLIEEQKESNAKEIARVEGELQ